jgi:hypothetical protein
MRALVLPLLLLLSSPALAGDILVLSPKAFHASIAEWKSHREKQGHKVTLVDPGKDPRAAVIAAKPKFVLIVGDVKQVPAHVFPATIIKKWERDPNVANDNHTADIDGDHVPDVAIGRIPADTPDEAKLMLGKVIAYENSKDFGRWRRRINVVAGVGGFGAAQDQAIEQASTKFLKQSIPGSYDLHVTYCKPSSPYCPPPSKVMEITSERFNEGALFFAYIGHGWRNGFDRCKFKGTSYRILTEDAAAALESRHGMPIAFLLCCSTGHFDGTPDCISEVMIKTPRGPVAVISSSRVSMPYGNAPLAKELLEAVFIDRRPTLGEALLQAKIRAAAEAKDPQRKEIEVLAHFAYERSQEKRDIERVEHLYLYNLLGDPCMRIPHVKTIDVQAEIVKGELHVKVPASIAGQVTVELIRERSKNRKPRKGDTERDFRIAYENANRTVILDIVGKTEGKNFSCSAAMPAGTPNGTYAVRVWVAGDGEAAMGVTPVKLAE